jgi:limonene-1,2-epoxide hydrolase
MTPSETVTEFVNAMCRKDFDAAFALAADDMEFENVPLDPSVVAGKDSIRAGLELLFGLCSRVEWDIPLQIESGTTVVNERVDKFWFDDGAYGEVPVLARWEVVDGKIKVWRDYYDLGMWDQHFDGGYFAYMGRPAQG